MVGLKIGVVSSDVVSESRHCVAVVLILAQGGVAFLRWGRLHHVFAHNVVARGEGGLTHHDFAVDAIIGHNRAIGRTPLWRVVDHVAGEHICGGRKLTVLDDWNLLVRLVNYSCWKLEITTHCKIFLLAE